LTYDKTGDRKEEKLTKENEKYAGEGTRDAHSRGLDQIVRRRLLTSGVQTQCSHNRNNISLPKKKQLREEGK